ncbi:unnamed protein product [Rodentolepis nana]|uniref:ANK_REP_REGION domain-containing protein n=1 Tax=Rodentolepis nana TaxID=102285 RepID=A0A0R3TQY6_RODNA|nr:unnamed protein product [Rodentolepis nana]
MKDLDKSEENLCFQKENFVDDDDDSGERGRKEDGEGPSLVTEGGEDSDDEQSVLQDQLLETDKRKVRRLKRKKRDTECSLGSSEEETETMVKKELNSTDTSGTESTPEVLDDEDIEPQDKIFRSVIEAVRNEKFDYAMELFRRYVSFASVKIGPILPYFYFHFDYQEKIVGSKEEKKAEEEENREEEETKEEKKEAASDQVLMEEKPCIERIEDEPTVRNVLHVDRFAISVEKPSLIDVAMEGLAEEMRDLLRIGEDPLECDLDGNTPLHHAAALGHLKCVTVLIEQRVPLEPLNDAEITPLMMAAQNGHVDVVNLFLEHGALSEYEKSRSGKSPLTFACLKEREDVIHIFLNSKQRPIGKRELDAALVQVALKGSPAVADLLIETGADVNTHEQEGLSPLHAAIFAGNAAMVELLIARGADLEFQNRNGYRPLMEAVRRGHRDIAESLLLAGAAVESASETDQSITPLRLASEYGDDRILVLLEKFRALAHLD